MAANNLVPPKLKIYTDGGFPDVEGFSLGNLEPEVVVIGKAPPPLPEGADSQQKAEARTKPPSNNVAILALQTRRNEEKPDVYQVFGRVHNYKAEDVEAKAQLFKLDPAKPGTPGTLVDAIALKIGKQADQSFNFDLPDTGAAELEVRIDSKDDLPLDNRAFTLIGAPRKAQILVVTAGNRYLVNTLRTPLATDRADVIITSPDDYKTDAFKRDVAAGRFDLIIYDRVRPETPPEANALYFGTLPPGPAYEKSRTVNNPAILDVNASHPLMQFIRDLSVVRVLKATIVNPPPGSTVLFEGDSGPLAFVAPRKRVRRRRRRLLPGRRAGRSTPTGSPSTASPCSSSTPSRPWATPGSRPARRSTSPASRSSSGPRAPGLDDDHRPQGQDQPADLEDRPGDLPLQRGQPHRHLPRQVAARRGPGVRRQPVRPPGERPRPPGARPRRHAARPGRLLQDQDRLQPRRRDPTDHPGPARLVEAPGRHRPGRRLPGVVHLQPPGLYLTADRR